MIILIHNDRNHRIKALTAAIQQIERLNLDKDWQIEVKPYHATRTLSQNALLHKWLGIIASETGNDLDDIKDIMKQRFLPPIFVDVGGEEFETRRSTAKLTTVEMSEFMERILAFASSDLGIILPVPGDMHGR